MNKVCVLILALAITGVFAEPPRFRQQQQKQVVRQQQRFRSNAKFARQELEPVPDFVVADAVDDTPPYSGAGYRPSQPFDLPTEEEEQVDEPRAADEPSDLPADDFAPPAPYPAAGPPAGRLLALPARQQKAPKSSYSFLARQEQPPSQTYGVPQSTYGVPAPKYGAPVLEETTTEASGDFDVTTTEPLAEDVDLGEVQAEQLRSGRLRSKQQQGAYFVRLQDGSLQRLIFVPNRAAAPARLQAKPSKLVPVFIPRSFF